MAKETKETKKSQEVALTEENVVDQIRNGNLLKQDNVKAALEKIEKEKDEKQQNEARKMIMRAQYNNTKELLNLRARRREEKITKEALTKSKELLDEVLAGKITPTEYDKKRDELRTEKSKKIDESNKTLRQEIEELNNSYAGYYQYSWDY